MDSLLVRFGSNHVTLLVTTTDDWVRWNLRYSKVDAQVSIRIRYQR